MADQPSSASTGAPAIPSLGGRKPNFRERVVDVLRAALIAGELRPGELYSAPGLAPAWVSPRPRCARPCSNW